MEQFKYRLGDDISGIPFPRVEKCPLAYQPTTGDIHVMKTVPDRFALVNENNGDVFEICSNQYVPIPHEQVLQHTEKVIRQVPEYGNPEVKITLYEAGKVMQAEYHFDDHKVDIGSGDPVSPAIYHWNGFDRQTKLQSIFGAIQWICMNGAISGEVFMRTKRKHIPNQVEQFFQPEDIKEAFINFSRQTGIWKKWLTETTTSEVYNATVLDMQLAEAQLGVVETLIERITGEKVQHSTDESGNRIIGDDQIPANLTKWAFFSTLTMLATHTMTNHRQRIAAESRLRTATRRF